jgi:Ala-tRNA(Pro) deacylase
MGDVRAPIYETLSALGIQYEVFEHPPVFTAEEAALHWAAIPGAAVKNLFLRNKKGDRHYLVILGI